MNNPISIVFADDNPTERMLFEDAMLASREYVNDVKFSSDGVELLHLLRCEGKHEMSCPLHLPDLVVLDLNMPTMTGFEVLQEIRKDEKLKTIPVVVLSASDDAADIKRCYALGASGYIVKPGNHEDLKTAFLQLTSYWATLMRSH